MAKENIADAMTKLVALLTPFNSEERRRVIGAALTLLGDAPALGAAHIPSGGDLGKVGASSQRASAWMKRNGLTSDILDQVFHVDGEHVEVVASRVPGKSNKERTLNAYALAGAARLIAIGDSAFDDKYARELCGNLGCYDSTNHSKYLKERGNKLAGSASTGWKLTAPGLTHAAVVIKQLAPASA